MLCFYFAFYFFNYHQYQSNHQNKWGNLMAIYVCFNQLLTLISNKVLFLIQFKYSNSQKCQIGHRFATCDHHCCTSSTSTAPYPKKQPTKNHESPAPIKIASCNTVPSGKNSQAHNKSISKDCSSVYGKDEEAWQMMDSFKSYNLAVEHDLMDNISKLYLGKRVMMDIREVELQLIKVQEKIVGFLNSNSARIEEYNKRVQSINEARGLFSTYLQQIRSFYDELNKNYHDYLLRKLAFRMKEIDASVQSLKDAILR